MPKRKKSCTKQKIRKIHARELIIDDRQGTSFGGLSLIEKTASRLSVWSFAEKQLPPRRGIYDRQALVKGAVAGFLSGSRGSALLDAVKQDDALLRDMGIEGLPGEKVFCEDLERFGTAEVLAALNKITAHAAKRTLLKIEPEDRTWLHSALWRWNLAGGFHKPGRHQVYQGKGKRPNVGCLDAWPHGGGAAPVRGRRR